MLVVHPVRLNLMMSVLVKEVSMEFLLMIISISL